MRIVLIPGFWLDGSSWEAVAPVLERAGHRTRPVTLPGMESRGADRAAITFRDHVDAVIQVIDFSDPGVVLVAHSGGGPIAHAALDARPDRVARVVHVECVPMGEGAAINDALPVADGEIPLPDWSFFDETALTGLDERSRAQFRERAIPTPARVAKDPMRLHDERRCGVPATVISCESSSAELRELVERGHVQELAKIRDVHYLDLPTGHWPQFSRSRDLGRAILDALLSTCPDTPAERGTPLQPLYSHRPEASGRPCQRWCRTSPPPRALDSIRRRRRSDA